MATRWYLPPTRLDSMTVIVGVSEVTDVLALSWQAVVIANWLISWPNDQAH